MPARSKGRTSARTTWIKRKGHKQRDKHGKRYGDSELVEEPADDPAHEATGTKTAMIENVVAITARPISEVPARAAS